MLPGVSVDLRQDAANAQLTELLPAAVYVYDLERGTSVTRNRFANQLLGYGPDETGPTGAGFPGHALHPEDASAMAAHLDLVSRLDDGASASVEYRLRHRDGSWRWLLGHDVVLRRDERGRVQQVLGIAADITERKEAEALLARSEGQLRALFSFLDEGFCLCEVITDDQGRVVDYRFLSVNPLFEDMTGLSGVVGRTAGEVLPDVDAGFLDICARVALGGESVRLECGSSPDGRWFDVFTVPMSPRGRFAVVFRDQTERHRAETAMRAAAEADHFRATLGDSLRSLSDPLAVQAEAARVLGEHLGAAGAHYAEVTADCQYAVVNTDYHPGTDSLVGRHRFDDHGPELFEVYRSGRPIVVHDVRRDPRLAAEACAASTRLGIGAYVMAPLAKGGRPVAQMGVHHAAPHEWTPDEIALVEEAVDRTWSAVERVRAERALRANEAAERSGRLRAERVAELLTELGSIEGARWRLKRLVGFLTEELADHACVEVPGSPGQCLAESTRWAGGCDPVLDVGTRSRIDAPIELGERVRGLLVLRVLDPDREPFGPDDEAFVQEIADRAGLVLSRASLREEEHRTSLRLQRALLPDTLREHPDILVDAHYEAASTLLEVGGDWYDSYSWPQGQLGVMVGDVMGHDLPAAVAMGRLRAGVGALVAQVPPRASEVLEALDRCASGPDGTEFVTACAVVLDPRDGRLRYSRAGHPPALLVPPAGEPVWLDGAASVPVSGLPVGRRPEAAVGLEPGTVVILFSDGLVERRGESLLVGLDRLRLAAARLVRSGEPDLASQLAAALAEESVPEDDVVVVTLRFRPGDVAAGSPVEP